MILIVFLLFFLGCIAIMLEALLPAAISATLGLVLIGLSCYLAFRETSVLTGMLYTFMALIVSLLLTRTTVRSGIKWFNLKPPKKMDPPINSKQSERPRLGDLATVVQPLRPTGTVEWHGRRFAARSLRPERELPAGRNVRIQGQDSIFLLVEEIVENAEVAAQAPAEDGSNSGGPET